MKHINNLWRSIMTSISSKKSLADKIDEDTIGFGGSYCSNLIMSSIARIRLEVGIIKQAKLRANDNGFFVDFYGANGKPLYKGNALTLSGSNGMPELDTVHTEKNFKNEAAAISYLNSLGFDNTDIIID